MRPVNTALLIFAVCAAAFILMGAVPFIFAAGTTISAAEVNANFAALDSGSRRGTLLLSGKVLGGTGEFSAGAFTSLGGAPSSERIGVGTYEVFLPGGEGFDEDEHGVAVTPNVGGFSVRVAVVNQLAATTAPIGQVIIKVRIMDAAAAPTDTDFQIVVFNN